MEAILANSKRLKEVLKIHTGLKQMFEGLTLEQVLIAGFNWKREKIEENIFDEYQYKRLSDFFYQWDYKTSTNQLSDFKLYNMPAITRHARYRAVFLQDCKRKGYDLNKRLSIATLEELSCLSIGYSTVTYAIKCYLISNYSEDELMNYKGIQPQTGPVHNANELLFGARVSNYEHTVRCNLFSEEIELSSTYINSAFYTIG